MAKLRPGKCYRRLERPYTRKSRYRKKSFVRGVPGLRIARFEVGDTKGGFEYQLDLVSDEVVQIRHNALESARLAANRYIQKKAGSKNYHLIIRSYPHHVLREHKLMAGAGADRFSSGMRRAFGKPVGTAAQVKKGSVIMSLRVNGKDLDHGRVSLVRASKKLPCKCRVRVLEKVVNK